jgi:hypothetical protein
MLAISHRAANDLDLRAVTQGRGTLQRNVATLSAPAGIVVGGIAYAFSRSWWIAVAAGVGLFGLSLCSNLMFFRRVRHCESLRADSTAVEVLEVSANRVLDVEVVGDNEPAFCFFVEERKALLVVGQWLHEYDFFPSKRFCLHLWSETKIPIRIDAIGPTAIPERSGVQLRTTYRTRKFELIDASPDTLQADLDSTFGSATFGSQG